jgi:hypothetical protein
MGITAGMMLKSVGYKKTALSAITVDSLVWAFSSFPVRCRVLPFTLLEHSYPVSPLYAQNSSEPYVKPWAAWKKGNQLYSGSEVP